MNRFILFLGCCLTCPWAQATVTFNIDAADLRTAGGELMPLNGQVLLVASPTDAVFGGPTPDAFVTGDDVILFRGELNLGMPGIFQASVNFAFESFPGLNPGDPVQLYWFPTLTAAATSPGEGATYGAFRHETGLDGSAPWVIPGDGALVDLKFITMSQGGSHPNLLGYASGVITRPVILSLTGAGTPNVVITWSAVSNLTYRVQYRPDFNTAWLDLTPDVTATNVTASATDHAAPVDQRFYRVLLVP
ncbi:MAG: hypothetical protein IH623_22265 [Verrucomicrobia bacterium]|nr:hypothetical protein [Verrucomicrobiota bacterium]